MDDETFDCIRCGQTVYHTLNSCPHCGLDFYPDDDEPEEKTPARRSHGAAALRRVAPLIAGIVMLMFIWLVAASWLPRLFSPLLLVLLVALLIAAYAGHAYYRSLRRRAQPREATEDSLYLDLLQRLSFDHARVQRLLDIERQAAPAAARGELLRRAMERWERDNH